MNVLIVDDSKAMQNIITKSMKSVGYQNDLYSYAADGEEALRVIHSEHPDLVLCDMHMPKMTGLELLKTLRSEKDTTKIVIVSIDDNTKTLESVTSAGGDAFLKKPFTSEQLFNTVSKLLGKTLAKKSKPDYEARDVIPDIPVLERVFSSLAAADVKLTRVRFEDIDFNRSPFYGGTFQNDQERVILSVFLDALASNTIAAIINHWPLAEAVKAAQNKLIGKESKQALLIFLGIFSGLCKPSASGQLLDIHAEQFAENANTHLSRHMSQYSESAAVFSLSCGPSQGGKIIMTCS